MSQSEFPRRLTEVSSINSEHRQLELKPSSVELQYHDPPWQQVHKKAEPPFNLMERGI